VHRISWKTWQEELSNKRLYKVSESERQEPGVIQEHVFTSLASSVEELPRKAVSKGNGAVGETGSLWIGTW